jgi:dihydrofolate reductase
MNAIVSADLDWGIGYRGNLLERIPEDMKLFKQLTFGNTIIMGRKTFESLPDAMPLHGRTNIVLSKTMKDSSMYPTNMKVFKSEDDVISFVSKLRPSTEVFIIGGAEIYKMFLSYCDIIYVTKVQKRYNADRFFKNIDIGREFRLVKASDPYSYNGVSYNFLKYERVVEKKNY